MSVGGESGRSGPTWLQSGGESRAEAAHLVSRIELRRCWVVLATQDQYTLIDFMGRHTHTHIG